MRTVAASRLRVSTSHRQAAARNASALAQRYAWTVIARVPMGDLPGRSMAYTARMFRDMGGVITLAKTCGYGKWVEFDLHFQSGAPAALPHWAHEVSRCRAPA